MAKTIKVKFGIYISNGGDGSYASYLVLDEAVAQRLVERELTEYGQAVEDGGASEVEILVDVETGEIVRGLEPETGFFDDEEEEDA